MIRVPSSIDSTATSRVNPIAVPTSRTNSIIRVFRSSATALVLAAGVWVSRAGLLGAAGLLANFGAFGWFDWSRFWPLAFVGIGFALVAVRLRAE